MVPERYLILPKKRVKTFHYIEYFILKIMNYLDTLTASTILFSLCINIVLLSGLTLTSYEARHINYVSYFMEQKIVNSTKQ
jgi:hypothetical protein